MQSEAKKNCILRDVISEQVDRQDLSGGLRWASVVETIHKLLILAKNPVKRIEGYYHTRTTLLTIGCIVSLDGNILDEGYDMAAEE